MAPNLVHLPNGQTFTVTTVFGGLFFKANELNVHHAVFPPGWTIILQSEDEEDDHAKADYDDEAENHASKRHHVHRYRQPTLTHDNLFISSISSPSSSDFRPATSPTRQIAMMLWATLWWYFHQSAPNPHLTAGVSSKVPEAGRPKGEWRINIKREGIFKGRHLLQKLERMGLISSEDSSVGADPDDRHGEGWTEMFVSQRSFWQLDARLFLFTLSPTLHSPYPGSSPYPSRPGSPNRDSTAFRLEPQADAITQGLWSPTPSSPGPFASSSHLPTYYPPPPPQYTFTNRIRHPIRSKPPRQGETFYTRYIPSLGQYLSFRVVSLSPKPPAHNGPVSSTLPSFLPPNSGILTSKDMPSMDSLNHQQQSCDTELLRKWMNDARISAVWGASGPLETQENFLKTSLRSKHSFPVIGCWDGKPFGYFEIYWVKEDQLGRYLAGNDMEDWDRGFHVLVGEQEFRGEHRVKVWLSALVHYCWLAHPRTQRVLVEPRVDNEKFIGYLHRVGFYKEREIAFPFKQAALMKVKREAWEAPAL